MIGYTNAYKINMNFNRVMQMENIPLTRLEKKMWWAIVPVDRTTPTLSLVISRCHA